ncbi:MAG: hypothetical protein ACK4FP_14735 [Azonexus sp.]
MNYRNLFALLLALLMTGMGSSAWAHGGRVRLGVHVGVGAPVWGPVWGPVWYPPPYYYPPQVIVVPPAQPPVYVEQADPAAQPVQQYWYYCKSGKGYYPYVKECPEGWQKVLPQPEQ